MLLHLELGPSCLYSLSCRDGVFSETPTARSNKRAGAPPLNQKVPASFRTSLYVRVSENEKPTHWKPNFREQSSPEARFPGTPSFSASR